VTDIKQEKFSTVFLYRESQCYPLNTPPPSNLSPCPKKWGLMDFLQIPSEENSEKNLWRRLRQGPLMSVVARQQGTRACTGICSWHSCILKIMKGVVMS